jgi:uncharacterized protein YbaR (Trm112 family)
LIESEGDTLVFRPRDGQRAPFGDVFHGAYDKSALLRNWWAANRSLFHHSVEWQGGLSVRVEGSSAAEETAALDLEQTTSILDQLHRAGALRPHTPEVLAVLRCPDCRGRLSFGPSGAACKSCGRAYPVIGEVPVLLREAAR